jgi:nicotinamidase-related amidase
VEQDTGALTTQPSLAVPEGSVLLHIGPPKTATTQLQAALFAARHGLPAHGVRHAGGSRHPAAAIHAVLGRKSAFAGGKVPPISRWNALAREVRRAGEPRVIVSSEFLADALPEHIERIVADLSPRDVHVVVTLRPLAQILPSQWQQHVCDGSIVAFEDWLDAVFRHPGRRPGSSFWRRHRHDELVERWAAVIGAPKVTVIALADGDRGGVLRHAETLLGLEPGLLAPQAGLANRSLTLPEVEAVRAFNAAMIEAGLPRRELDRLVHFGASRYLKGTPADPAAPRIPLPASALGPIDDAARGIVEGIRASGVHVMGDLDALAVVPRPPADEAPASVNGDPSVAASLAVGVMIASGLARPGSADDPALALVPTYALAGVVARRSARMTATRLRRLVPKRRVARS